jgi:hypothetical protein
MPAHAGDLANALIEEEVEPALTPESKTRCARFSPSSTELVAIYFL